MGELPLEAPPEVQNFVVCLPCNLVKLCNAAPGVVGHLAPVDLECLSSRLGESPYSLCPFQLLNSGLCSHLAMREAGVGDLLCQSLRRCRHRQEAS